MKAVQRVANNDTKHRVADTRQSSRQSPLAQIDDKRPEVVAQRDLLDGIHNSPRMVAQRRQIEGYQVDKSQHTSLVKTSPVQLALPVQAKLTIGQPDDQYEQEADRVAAQVVDQILVPVTDQAIQSQSLQHEILPEEALQPKLKPQSHESIKGGDASNHLETAINHAKGGGRPLDAHLQQSMGQAMGVNFSGVRVHTDAQSDQLNLSMRAKAFTTGQDVFFRQGAYQPETQSGQALIAHELTHVIQQKGAVVQRSPLIRDYPKHQAIDYLVQRMRNESDDEEWRPPVIKCPPPKGYVDPSYYDKGIGNNHSWLDGIVKAKKVDGKTALWWLNPIDHVDNFVLKGTRARDVAALKGEGNLFTWHHCANYTGGKCTMQLVPYDEHSTWGHYGGAAQAAKAGQYGYQGASD